MSGNVKAVKKQNQFCLHCKKKDEKEKYYEIFDEVGVQLKLNELLFKYFKLKIVKTNSRKDQVICEQCLDKLTTALDEDEYNKKKNRTAEAKKVSSTNTNKVVVAKLPNNQSNDKDNKSEKKISKTTKKTTTWKEEETIEILEDDDDKKDDIKEILQEVLAKNPTETLIVEQTESNEETSVFVIKGEEYAAHVADAVDGKVILDGTEILLADIERFNTEDDTISLTTQNGIQFVISDGDGGNGDGEHSEVINEDETYEDFERIEDCPNEEGAQDGIELCTLIPFSKEDDDDQVLDIKSLLDEAIKSNLTTFKFSWSTQCHICSWNCETFESLVAHVYRKHKLTNNLYACPAKDCAHELQGKELLTRHLILQHGPLNKLLIYGSCPDCGLTFSNFIVFNKHSCARMIKRRRGMRLYCKLCEIDLSSMKRYVFHMQFHLEKHRPKICLICNYKSNDIEELFEHINYDHELQDVYSCRICDRTFKEKQKLLDHKHLSDDQFICKVCNRSFQRKSNLMAHMKSSHATTLQCHLCNKKFSNEANYRHHQKSHMYTSTALHACSNCGLISADRGRILDHVNQTGSDCFGVAVEDEVVSVAYTCEFCSLDFVSKCDLKLHRSTGVHADKQYFCLSCNKSFASMKSYRSHRKHVTSQWERANIYYLFMCNVDECEESYTLWNSLYTHKRRHHNVIKTDDANSEEEAEKETDNKNKAQNFVCQFCDKVCPTKMSLSLHIARRHNNKNVVCSVCNASLKNEQALKKHFDYLHVAIECSKCLKVVKNRRNYEVHERIVHMAEKRYFCNLCSKGFYRKNEKEAHVRLHEEIYKCEQCDFTTNYAKSLDIHFSSVHRREFNYECEVCKQKFARKPALKVHIAKHCKLKRFVCEKSKDKSCQKAFPTLALLNRHLKYKHDDDGNSDNDQSMLPTDHEEGAPPVKRSKRLQMKNSKNFTDDDVDDPMTNEEVLSVKNEIQDDKDIVDGEIELLANEFIPNE